MSRGLSILLVLHASLFLSLFLCACTLWLFARGYFIIGLNNFIITIIIVAIDRWLLISALK
jgi:hypothetical protein